MRFFPSYYYYCCRYKCHCCCHFRHCSSFRNFKNLSAPLPPRDYISYWTLKFILHCDEFVGVTYYSDNNYSSGGWCCNKVCMYVFSISLICRCAHDCRGPRVRRMWRVRHFHRVIIVLLVVVVVVNLLLRPSSTSSSPASIFVVVVEDWLLLTIIVTTTTIIIIKLRVTPLRQTAIISANAATDHILEYDSCGYRFLRYMECCIFQLLLLLLWTLMLAFIYSWRWPSPWRLWRWLSWTRRPIANFRRKCTKQLQH